MRVLARKAGGRRQEAEGNSDSCLLPRPKGVRVEAYTLIAILLPSALCLL